jgi:hypothetical protein
MSNSPKSLRDRDPEKYARLKAEAIAPYRGLRKFIYLSFGASGAIGAVVFFTQILAGRDIETAVPNLMLQFGVIGLMVWLFRFENRKSGDNK